MRLCIVHALRRFCSFTEAWSHLACHASLVVLLSQIHPLEYFIRCPSRYGVYKFKNCKPARVGLVMERCMNSGHDARFSKQKRKENSEAGVNAG